MEVVGEADNGPAALDLVTRVQPDVLLLDLNLPGGMNGLDVLRQLESSQAGTRTVLLSAEAEPSQIRAAVQHGAYGVLLKHAATDSLIQCIRQVASGEYFLAAGQAGSLVGATRPPFRSAPGDLTPGELTLVREVVRGLSNEEIAAHLGITEQTVHNHLQNIFEKLKVGSRAELAMLAVERQIAERPN